MTVSTGEMYIGIQGAGFAKPSHRGNIAQTTVTFSGASGTIVMQPRC
jgi:hypothetical protein